jgi:hypothetical protein
MAWPKSIRWRYSLRALFVFITVFMLWGGYHVESFGLSSWHSDSSTFRPNNVRNQRPQCLEPCQAESSGQD